MVVTQLAVAVSAAQTRQVVSASWQARSISFNSTRPVTRDRVVGILIFDSLLSPA